ncbi:cyclin-dependent kinase C-1-like isoform X2 [Primulina eburnea]|uniref:cyclin-dependent kinase C-1-like isoform X2 n=1 Tax=Primulina eburnea TaxID=1245227 RepID=UPI003C6C2C34
MAAATNNQLNVEDSPSWGSRSVECFEKLEQIGEGTYGQVYMAREKDTGEIVALKKIRMDNEKEGFPITAIREIKILKKLEHDNVIKLKEIVTSPGREGVGQGNPDDNKYKGSIYMVFEYMDHDLTGLADRPGLRFSIEQIKCYMKQLLTGLHYCHVNQVLHRDIKGSNLLIDNEGNLKLADFGLARSFSNDHNANLTNRVITLWYRPPELLLGATKYGPSVDMWSVGCIFAELLYGKPILPGKNEPEQLNKIFELCGTPDEVNWPGVSKIPWYNKFKPARQMKRRTRELFRHFDRHALELLENMLVLDPAKRISAKDALDAEYFWTDPLPCDPKRQRKKGSSSDKTKKLPKDRSYSIHSSTLACLPSNRRGNLMHNTGLVLVIQRTILSLLCLLFLVIISMENLVVHQVDLIDTPKVGPLVHITKIVEVRAEHIIVGHIPRMDEGPHMLEIVPLLTALKELQVDTELPLIIRRVVNMEFQAAEAQIQWGETETSSTDGSSSRISK